MLSVLYPSMVGTFKVAASFYNMRGGWWEIFYMIKKVRILLSVPFMLLSALFKMIALRILPAEHREKGKEVI